MKSYFFVEVLAAGALMAPAAHAQDGFVTDYYLTSIGPATGRWMLEGYSYIGYPYGSGPYPIGTQATITPGVLAQSQCGTEGANSGWCDVTIGSAEADVAAGVYSAGTYTLQAQFEWDEWLVGQLFPYETLLYSTTVTGVPTGESFAYATGNVNPYGANFYLNLKPSGTGFDGTLLDEEFASFQDGCYNGTGPQLTAPGPWNQTYIGSYGSFSDLVTAGDDDWINYWGQAVASGQSQACGWQVYETLTYNGWDFVWNTNGQMMSPRGLSFSLRTFRGNNSYTNF